ncbi:hypothetical protein [Candidatus Berkiella aquae]|uniref:Uncharacterized protein n=1 Tax=Candidatus Berkiella aquae TaxID=295108 RepID=A0A0Q9Z294_9GAMM|nr:hypothetical protein [Candidatus Berkiella aquae]MCS5712040.1 hypothetical protein [Candidatus Berkiella aquae]
MSKDLAINWCIDGAWSLGLATLITGAVSPLTLLITGGFLTIQAAGDFPVARFCRTMAEKIYEKDLPLFDRTYTDQPLTTPDQSHKLFQEEMKLAKQRHNSRMKEFYTEMGGCSRKEKPFNDDLDSELTQNECVTFKPLHWGWSVFPNVAKLLNIKEQEVTRKLAPVSKDEIEKMPYGSTRKGTSFKVM